LIEYTFKFLLEIGLYYHHLSWAGLCTFGETVSYVRKFDIELLTNHTSINVCLILYVHKIYS